MHDISLSCSSDIQIIEQHPLYSILRCLYDSFFLLPWDGKKEVQEQNTMDKTPPQQLTLVPFRNSYFILFLSKPIKMFSDHN